MNTAVLQKYNLIIKKDPYWGCDISGPLEGYIDIFQYVTDVDEFINDIELAINGGFDQIEDPEWSAGRTLDLYWNAFITPTHFEVWFYTQDESEKIVIPLEDWKEILLSWKECLES
ncbi:hypothetical protein [uncultured Dokdonia sp.]|uniref:hypothetical protein n=1 Tax=uncultured Dokdonia sp. TaxID=575653 RepID=UPI0026128F40|nr:hypothetical protein [uncultured Dokdonia sp.]